MIIRQVFVVVFVVVLLLRDRGVAAQATIVLSERVNPLRKGF